MSDLDSLRKQLDDTIAAERQAITTVRRQIDAIRPIAGPATGLRIHPDIVRAAELRSVLRAHQDALTRTLARRDRVEREIEDRKRVRYRS